MANKFYTVTYSFTDGTLARGSEVRSEFNSVVSAFNSLESFYDAKFIPLDTHNLYNLGAKAVVPNLDNSGGALRVGASYFDTTYNSTGYWSGVRFVYPVVDAQRYANDAYNSAQLAASSASTASGFVASTSTNATNAANSAAQAAASAVTAANAAAQNTGGIATALNNHIADDTKHLSTEQDALLDGITVTATQLNNTVSGLSTHVSDSSIHLTPANTSFLSGITASASDINAAANGFASHFNDDARHLTSAQNTLIDSLTASATQLNSVATAYPAHAADNSIHVTPAEKAALLSANKLMPILTRSSNTVLSFNDLGSIIVCTASFTQTLQAAATLTNGWWCEIRNTSSGVVVIDPNAAETISGAATLRIYPNEHYLILCNGTSFSAFFMYYVDARYTPSIGSSLQTNSVNTSNTTSGGYSLTLPVPSLVKNGSWVEITNVDFSWGTNTLTVARGLSTGTTTIQGDANSFLCNRSNVASVTFKVLATDSSTFIKWGVI